MEGKRLIERIRLTNFLSFGPEGEEISLEPLNVLIGANSSGKSNFLGALELLQILPQAPIRLAGGISELLWKGGEPSPISTLEVTIDYPEAAESLRYRFRLGGAKDRLEVVEESVACVSKSGGPEKWLYRYEADLGLIEVRSAPILGGARAAGTLEVLPPDSIKTNQSMLYQLRDPVRYPELTYLAEQFSSIALYLTGWRLEANHPPRIPAAADEPEDYLLPAGNNLALVLNDLFAIPAKKAELLERLKRFSDRIEDVSLRIRGGVVGIEFRERGLSAPVSARHISDGVLRFLMLLAILCHPEPPPLVCIDEPEHGLHPDAIQLVAELLRDAAERCQLVVTTHSDVLVSALSETPEAVIVCERNGEGTRLRRLERAGLADWLEKYTLGDLWQMGEIGGRQ